MRVPVRALTVQIHTEHGRGQLAESGALGQFLLEERGIEVPGRFVAVDEDRSGTHVLHRVGSGDERERRDDDVVSRPDVVQDQRQVERGGPARQGGGGPHVGERRELLLEPVDVRAERRDPVGVERVQQESPLLRADVGGRQEEPRHRSTVLDLLEVLSATLVARRP